jgi:KaiC/GvpD/RAD55 family RecA-like ATPase
MVHVLHKKQVRLLFGIKGTMHKGNKGPVYDHHHAVQFYGDDASLFTTVAGFLSQGFVDGHPAIVIATEDHRTAILEHLRGRLIDVDKAQQMGSLIVLDARQTLDLFMENGMPDRERFEASVGKLIAEVLEGREDRILIRAYGEMVDVLWKEGKSNAAIRLEMLWNRLAQRYGFALLCGYSMGNFYKETKGFEQICREHTHIVAARAEPAVAGKRTN